MVGNRVQMKVTDCHNNQQRTQVITVDDMNNVYDRTIGDGRNGKRQVRLPTCVAVDLPKPFIVLVNHHNGNVKKVYKKQFEVKIFNSTLQRALQHPVAGSVYVADTGNNKIKILDVDLTHLRNYPPHEGDDVLNQPHDISFVEDDNNVYMFVANHGNDRILVFRANNDDIQHLHTIQMEGEAGGQPTSIAFHMSFCGRSSW